MPDRYDALAGGITATWGELAIEVALDDGDRRYAVRDGADADGAADEVRVSDVGNGATGYRVRFLRAKRFDERLCGVPTREE